MIAVLAGRYDAAAHRWASRWASRGVALLTPEDLSQAGWRHSLDAPADGVAIVSGQPVCVAEISGVLVRLPCVYEQELTYIAPADRGYVAAEMTAFLLSWLTALPCPVLNRPTPTCLAGPFWRPEQWAYAAARAGIPVAPVRCRVAPGATLENTTAPGVTTRAVTVVGEHCVGERDEALIHHARTLAGAAKVALLAVRFSGSAPGASFMDADLWPHLDDDLTEAIFAYLDEQAVERPS
jgi:hypothetical protein